MRRLTRRIKTPCGVSGSFLFGSNWEGFLLIDVINFLLMERRILDVMQMDEEEDDLCTPHKLFNLFSMCTLPSTTTTQTKMEAGADDSNIRQDLHHSSVVGDHIYNSFMFVVFMHFSLYY